MKTLLSITIAFLFIVTAIDVQAAPKRYGERHCAIDPNTECYKVKRGETWEKLFPNAEQRDVVKRLNRLNQQLRPGWVIAIPANLGNIDHFDIAPFPLVQDTSGQKTVVVDLNKLAWAAYNADGHLIHWGPASGGKDWCANVGRPCRTQTGNYTIYRKQGYSCISSKYPLPHGGAAMPYCMHYHGAYALHGSFDVPGYNDSHGCVRMFIADARWLNQKFVDNNTKIIVKPY